MSLNGIDVASYQAGMNVGEVAGDFVLVKATEGIDYTNPEFNGHAKQTLSAGKKLGVYHFIRNDSDIKQQADYFLTVVKPFIGKAMLVLDFENTTGSTIQNQAGVGLAKQWLDYVYQQTGVRPVLYTGINCENSLDWSSVVNANYGLWIAQYNNYNVVNGYQPRDLYGSLKHWKTAVMFQYTSTGRLPGWNGNLDFDVFYGDKSAWDKYAKATKATKAVKPKPAAPKWVKEKKTYTLKTAVKLRTAPSTSASVIAVLPAGSTVRTDQAIIQNGYRWVRQPRSGGYGYLATGPESNTLEYVK
ncbi:GH25 family lysozyme [Lactiplantibacillus plantarum]|uniref:GH25 family lysozyme n=1 Tax=Lactiplantibacillus plantarum TaxID=1590 RepID=UPI000C9EEDE5|nr:GH25 family lysozyme [Lactiplantibacillus plantarum]AUS70764.1 Autolytic lysozyme [Lactiplantibacillus plantarum]USZ13406.1 SH3 domain-containing protein [Lactiplantibacillus plantarum]UVE91355.1 SH3 domain-containing protein [Lactiplantibacillus plantarum]